MAIVTNAAGRAVPTELNGKALKPYSDPLSGGSPASPGAGRRLKARAERGAPSKLLSSWDELLDRLDLHDGMTISFHHHLRDGDAVVNETVSRIAARGYRDLVIAPTSLFPVHDALVPFIESGVISRIEGSMRDSVGVACSLGKMRGVSVLRSHGGRCRAIEEGELPIDLAVIAAPCADPFGNANGVIGKSACGPLAYPLPDSLFAKEVVVVTDGLVPYPCRPWSIQGGNVDYVLSVDSIGDPRRIVSGSTKLGRSPTQLLIADLAARFADAVGAVHEGFSFQAGAGGISLTAVAKLGEIMRAKGVKASFAHGGGTGVLVDLLKEGLVGSIIDLQSFDLEAVNSLREDPRHIESNPFASYGPRDSGCVASMLDLAILGATEVDLDFNVNVVTHSDGWILHGIGGHQDAAASASCCIVTAPSFRKRIPIVRERVTTITCPGSVVDAVVTERGIAVNPARKDLADKARSAGLPLVDLGRIMKEVREITGKPEEPRFTDRTVALVEWRDGSALDVIRELDTDLVPSFERTSE